MGMMGRNEPPQLGELVRESQFHGLQTPNSAAILPVPQLHVSRLLILFLQ